MSSLLIALILRVLSRSARLDSYVDRPLFLVPMDEIVRAFNWVIEKGWVRDISSCTDVHINRRSGLLLGYIRVDCSSNRGGLACVLTEFILTTTFSYLFRCRRQTWPHGSHS